MNDEMILADIVVDCSDAKRMQEFYLDLLGWQAAEFFGHPAVKNSNGVMYVFIQEDDYVPPVWPEVEGKQQKQVHFDYLVDDLKEMVAKAESLGAVKAVAQFGGEAFITMLDPDGHPFCLCQK